MSVPTSQNVSATQGFDLGTVYRVTEIIILTAMEKTEGTGFYFIILFYLLFSVFIGI